MSTVYQAFVFFGQKLNEDKFVTVEEQRMCNCNDVTVYEPKYCPECGSIWSRQVKVTKISQDQIDAGELNKKLTIRRFDYNYYLIYTDSLVETETVAMIDLSDQDKANQAIKAALEPLDLWDSSKFGLWTACDYY